MPARLQAQQSVRVALPSEPTPIMCFGTVVWTRPDSTGRSLKGCTAGILFTHRNQAAIEEFIMVHGDL